jgi:hypothetical protein
VRPTHSYARSACKRALARSICEEYEGVPDVEHLLEGVEV